MTSMYMLGGVGYGDLVSHRVKDAPVRGNASLYAGGIYPGHAPMVALAVSAMCERIEQISVLESLEISGYANEKLFRAHGFDHEMEDPEALARAEASCGSFRDQVSVMARALGVQLDELRFAAQFASADSTTDFGFMTFRQGRIAGIRGAVVGMLRDRSVIECRFVWTLGSAMTPNWPIVDGYLIEIEGSPQVRRRIEPLSAPFDGAVTTVMPLLNAIPSTCAAAAGIVNQMDLPFVPGYRTVR